MAIASTPARTDGRITSGTRSGVLARWGIALAVWAVSAPLIYFLPQEWAKGNRLGAVGLVFPLIGLLLLYQAVRSTLQWRRFGALTLMLEPSPGVVGGAVTGVIELPERFPATTVFRVTLDCVHLHVSGSGRDRTTWERSLWQDQTQAQATPGVRGTRLSFRFVTGAGLPGTEPRSDSYHYWKVHVQADVPGVDLDHSFEIPMVPGTATANSVPAELRRTAAPRVSTRVVRFSREGGALILYYPPLRSPGIAMGLLLFGAICVGASLFLYKAMPGGFLLLIGGFMMAVFGLIGVGLLLLGIYQLANSLRVELSPNGVTTTRRVLGLSSVRRIARDEITGLDSRITSQNRSGDEFRVRYTLYALLRHGRKLAVGDDVPGRALADHLTDVIRQALNLK